MRVNAERGLVLDQVAVYVAMAVVHFRLGRDGYVLVCGAEQRGAGCGKEGGVREDDRDAVIEDAKFVEELGTVVDFVSFFVLVSIGKIVGE